MLVKNWMLPQQFSIPSDALAVEAVTIIRENNLKMLPVVDGGRLRGVVHRRDLSEAAYCVSGSGDVCELNYFCNKLKVKDVMVRMPLTISVDDTVEETLIKGRDMMMSTFPVLDGEKVVGVVSDREIFVTLFKLLEAGQQRLRVTLTDVTLEGGTLSKILRIVDNCGGVARSIFTVPEKNGQVRVVLRAECDDPETVRKAFEKDGYRILEFSA
ncbi:CBS domain-containing protein [Desulfomonile tiedjei]|uniref:CBS-domain-containing membrane protein n=1 Tax=Desulfomonile tiedjei (strain ATCC 49306 / DSM 6799 / DCB-1) TaxID=706587 RepID=I4C1W7_DESTA|nr:CBS domain-containing protein [Desulfomonile tiedjei]AFM23558.1 CBS-domain-containing membrane protein [Desulfomonile tiedjei DSM 6799]